MISTNLNKNVVAPQIVLWLAFIYMNSIGASFAETVSINVAPQITVNAEYQQGEKGKPLVVLLHGFLQTRNFETIQHLFTNIAEEGYSVLAPTLSLGVTNRLRSLPCEAIHLHSMENSTDEIHQWVSWAEKKNFNHVILAGHSGGSTVLTAYSPMANPIVQKIYLISPWYFGEDKKIDYETQQYADIAQRTVKNGKKDQLQKFGMGFCNNYVTRSSDYLSYFRWNRDKIINTIKNSTIPMSIIMGDKDERVATDLLSQFRAEKLTVHVVEGANHFFQEEYEFSLIDLVLGLLEKENS